MWEIKGWIELKASGVQARYALTDTPLPQTPEAIDALAQELFDIGITRESRDLARLEKVVETATAPACTSVSVIALMRILALMSTLFWGIRHRQSIVRLRESYLL